MAAPPRIALIAAAESRLDGDLSRLPGSPEIRRFSDLVAEAEDLRSFSPRLVVLRAKALTREDLGSLRILRALLPDAGCLAVVDADSLAGSSELAAKDSLPILADPPAAEALEQALRRTLSHGPASALDALLDMARAIADEINNPLLFVSGHLRLLHETLDPERDSELSGRLMGLTEHVHRIEQTMAKLRTFVRAAGPMRRRERVEIAPLLRAALAGAGPDLVVPDECAALAVSGDPVLIAAAVAHLHAAARELSRDATALVLVLGPCERGARLRIEFVPKEPVVWSLPRDAEPAVLARALRSSSAQLSLLVVQAIAQGHGGSAQLVRRPDERVVIDLVLP
jgi:signal transduction histidine kinase